ncbi:unnamed protein product [Amoebophrya sp. A120]|nr:unnamed protein product [Amoebophrya sp. A120]|eukprot:GSA120T00019152001.1
MVLEDRGVLYAMKPAGSTKAEYQNLADNYNCTRKRVFGIDTNVGTFNMNTNRATSSACKGLHPRGEYDKGTQTVRPTVIEEGMTRNGWPAAVRGGHIMNHIEPSDSQVHGAGSDFVLHRIRQHALRWQRWLTESAAVQPKMITAGAR